MVLFQVSGVHNGYILLGDDDLYWSTKGDLADDDWEEGNEVRATLKRKLECGGQWVVDKVERVLGDDGDEDLHLCLFSLIGTGITEEYGLHNKAEAQPV